MALRLGWLALVLLAVGLAACGGGGTAVSEPPADGGFSGSKAALYEYAYTHCLRLGTASAHSHPTGSKPAIYDLKFGYPVVMIGYVKPHGLAEWRAAKDGCAFGIVKAFADAHSSKAAEVCAHMAAFLPHALPECPRR